MRELAVALGIPNDAVAIEIRPEEVPYSTLTDYAPNGFQLAGLQVQAYSNGSLWSTCTIGYNTLSGGTYGAFVTASHCTGFPGPDPQNFPTTFFQPDGSGAYLGTEGSDPPFFSSATDWNCPSAQPWCRYSDAAMIYYTAATAPGSAGQGLIYGTTYKTGTFGQSGSREISGTLTITSVEYATSQGTVLDKIGSASGWTYGTVTDTCMDVSSGGRFYLCQNFVHATGTGGDSGAPVFFDNGDATVTLHGILRGGATDHYSYSPYGNIDVDFGVAPTAVRY